MLVNTILKQFPLEIYGRTYEILKSLKLDNVVRSAGNHIRVICYHDIPEIDLPSFERQLWFFRKEYKIINAQQLKDFVCGRNNLPDISVFITFDDGSFDQYQAAELLDRYDIQACFFVSTADRENEFLISRPGSKLRPMTWDQINDLRRRGHIIGSHTATHAVLSQARPDKIVEEIVQSKRALETAIGEIIEFFAFPYGTLQEMNREALLIATKHYEFNFNFVPGKNEFNQVNRFTIYRTGISPGDSNYYLRAVMNGLKDWPKRHDREKLRQLLL